MIHTVSKYSHVTFFINPPPPQSAFSLSFCTYWCIFTNCRLKLAITDITARRRALSKRRSLSCNCIHVEQRVDAINCIFLVSERWSPKNNKYVKGYHTFSRYMGVEQVSNEDIIWKGKVRCCITGRWPPQTSLYIKYFLVYPLINAARKYEG